MNIPTVIKTLILGISSSFFLAAYAQDESARTAANNQSKQLHVVIVSGPPHYSPDKTMPLMAEELRKHGLKVTLIQGEGNAEKKKKNVLPNIEVLAEADLAIFFMRWLQLDDKEWQPIEDYIKSGKPVMGFRTAGHGFNYPKGHERHNWNHDFGGKVFGTPYVVHMKGTTDIKVIQEQQTHPILTHIKEMNWISAGTLYLTKFSTESQEPLTPLLSGFGKISKEKTITTSFGDVDIKKEETATVAWTWKNEWGSKIFFTSLGHTGDFAVESFNRLWLNAVYWSLDQPVPDENTQIPTWKIEAKKKAKNKSKKKA